MVEIFPGTMQRFWSNSLLAAIAHAIAVSRYPGMSNSHAWDGVAYSVQDGMGGRGTAYFQLGENGLPTRCAGACFTLHTERKREGGNPPDPLTYFQQAPQEQRDLAERCFDYLLEDFEGRALPWVTSGFWSVDEQIISQDSFAEFLKHGGDLFEAELLTQNEALARWRERFALSQEEEDMALDLHRQKVVAPLSWVTLTSDQLAIIERNHAGIDEAWESFAEVNIRFRPV